MRKIAKISLTVVAIAGGYIGWKLYIKNRELAVKVAQLEEALRNSNDSLTKAITDKANLDAALAAEAAKNRSFSDQLDSVTNKLEGFEQLKDIDPELLQKYSKVYFLNENYLPSALTQIDTKYLSNKDKPMQFHDRAWMFLKNMLDAAQADNVNIKVASAYRSFGTQASLKSAYRVTYGAGTANSFSADQGYSEHQLGTAVDLTTPEIGGGLAGFDKTAAYAWLVNNAYKYGFILSYPKNNAYYVYEPWHWRFVGLDLAVRLHNEKKNFYDLDQREISSYLRNFFSATLGSV